MSRPWRWKLVLAAGGLAIAACAPARALFPLDPSTPCIAARQAALANQLAHASWIAFGPVVAVRTTKVEDNLFFGSSSGDAIVEVQAMLKGSRRGLRVRAPWGASWSDDMSRRGHRPAVGESYLVWGRNFHVDGLPTGCPPAIRRPGR